MPIDPMEVFMKLILLIILIILILALRSTWI